MRSWQIFPYFVHLPVAEMNLDPHDMACANRIPKDVHGRLASTAHRFGLDVKHGSVIRTASRFCFSVEHGDYNGTDLFGVGTDRFIWIAHKANRSSRIRLASENYLADGRIELDLTSTFSPGSFQNSWARFPAGVLHILSREGIAIKNGFDAVVCGNIPGGGMSRSASLTLNLILTGLRVNHIEGLDGIRIVNFAQAVENDFVGSPCGILDPLMIYFAKSNLGTHYSPRDHSVRHIPLGQCRDDFRLVSLDTGTNRSGLENSTYAIRRRECEQLTELARPQFGLECLADVRDRILYDRVVTAFNASHPHLCKRLKYVFEAQERFAQMLAAWQAGDIRSMGALFRMDGFGLRDDYQISGPELEAMCDLARTVDGVLGERMLGGGDKGAAGAIVLNSAVHRLQSVVETEYPKHCPELAEKFAVHACNVVDGITLLPGLND